MPRLLVHVEGQTEETFVNEVLRPHLFQCGFERVDARLLGNARQRDRRGGAKPWPIVREEIVRHLKSDRDALATTMVDYYGLPAVGEKAWPGRHEAGAVAHDKKAGTVEAAMALDLGRFAASEHVSRRFIPFVVIHEFEALLFSDCACLSATIGRPELRARFEAIRNGFSSPEHINDSLITAPSKRICGEFPQYEKVLYGSIVALEIGLDVIRRECLHFGAWLDHLCRVPSGTVTTWPGG